MSKETDYPDEAASTSPEPAPCSERKQVFLLSIITQQPATHVRELYQHCKINLANNAVDKIHF